MLQGSAARKHFSENDLISSTATWEVISRPLAGKNGTWGREREMELLAALGRILYSAMFIVSALSHFSQQSVAYAQSKGVPAPKNLVPLSGIVILIGGLSVLAGYKAQIGAWLLIIFLVPTTLMMHDFWTIRDPQKRMEQKINFLKNCSMLGGAMLIAYFGSGPLSLGY